MSAQPLQDRLIVRRVDAQTQTSGGLYIPTTAQEKQSEGVVISFGPGKRNDDGTNHPMPFKEGDRVLFAKYGAIEIKLDGQELLILREDDVLAILN